MTDIEFICNPSAGTGKIEPNSPAEDPTHDYHLKWESAYACPTGGSSGGNSGDGGGDGGGDGNFATNHGGWLFIIIFLPLVAAYFIVGCLVKKFYMGASGLDIIPNVVFWAALPGLVKDGNLFVVRKLLGLCGRGGYSQV